MKNYIFLILLFMLTLCTNNYDRYNKNFQVCKNTCDKYNKPVKNFTILDDLYSSCTCGDNK